MSVLLSAVIEELEWRGVLPSNARASLMTAEQGGPGILKRLVDVGVPPDEALLVVSQASGIALAPKRLIDSPDVPVDYARFIPHGGVAIGKRGDLPCVAFDDPERAASAQKQPGLAHVAVLVLPATLEDLRAAVDDDDFDSPKTATVDSQKTLHVSVDATDPDSVARLANGDEPSIEGAPPVGDDLDEGAETIVNDIASLAALASMKVPGSSLKVVDGPRSLVAAEPDSLAPGFTAKDLADEKPLREPPQEPVREPAQEPLRSMGAAWGAQAFDDGPTSHNAVDDGAGIDPALLAAVVVDEMHDRFQEPEDVDPSTVLTKPFTPEDEARYGAMKTSALKLHVDKEISVPSIVSDDDDDLFSDDDDDGASLLDEADADDVYDASGFDRDPLEAQPTVAVPTTDSQIATLHVQMQKAELDADDAGGPETIVTPLRREDDATRPTPAVAAVPVSTLKERAAAGYAKTGPKVTAGPSLAEPESPAHGHARGDSLRPPRTGPRGRAESSSSSGGVQKAPSPPRYEVQHVLGRGGMATVYLARDKVTGEDVALKILEAHLATDELFIERFRREMRATENLRHPNIVRCFDAGDNDDEYFIAAEYVDAGTLSQLLRSMGTLPVAVVVGIMEQALLGLQYAHGTGTVHRDLKPANVMFNKQGVLKICDFGIAKSSTDNTITQTGTLFGTPAYMSPEQAMGKDIDARSDLFSIGIVFYQLLTGENPFHFDNPSTSLFRISSGMYPPLFDRLPSVPQLLDDVIAKLLARDRDERYKDAQAALYDLEPLVKAIRSRHPDVERRVLADNAGVGRMLRADEASLHVAHGRVLLDAEQTRTNEGMFHMFQASRIDPDNYEATNALAQYRIDHQIRFEHPDDPRIDELEHAMGIKSGENKCTPAQLRRAVDLHQPHRDLYGMARYLRRYLRMMAQDAHMQMRFRELCGADPLAPFSPVPTLPKRANSKAASDDEVAVVVPAGQIRRKADPRAASAPRPAGRAAVVEERTPMAASTTVADPPTPSSGSNAPAPVVPDRPARDSLEMLQRAARQWWIETVRSTTGDRGAEGLREWFDDRFGRESRAELKKEAKELLATSKEVLSEKQKKLLQEAKKESFRAELWVHWGRHKRLILTVTAIFVTYSLLSYGCALLFSDDESETSRSMTSAPDSPAPAQPPVASPAPPAKIAPPPVPE
jgi:serine/threonine protein kinase